MAKGISNKRYTKEFKQKAVETILEEHLSYSEAAHQFKICHHQRVAL